MKNLVEKSLEEILNEVLQTIPETVQLIAVSKTKPIEVIKAFYDLGIRHFGENKPQEMVDKYLTLPPAIKWHQIGHLQTNKVKYIAPFVHLIHSLDSTKLLLTINDEALKNNRIIDCLIQFNISNEVSKYGIKTINEIHQLLDSYIECKNVRIIGVMGMASHSEDIQKIQTQFLNLVEHFHYLKSFITDSSFCEISMGMTNDYLIAIANGSTMVRIGSKLFGERTYN